MTPKEALKEITSEPKWYYVLNDKGERDTKKEAVLRVQALRILKGEAHHAAMNTFFGKFGKEVEIIVKNK